MSRFFGGVVVLVVGCCVPASAWSQGINLGNAEFFFCEVDNTPGGPTLEGFNTYQLRQNFDGQWTGSQLLLQLDSGAIYRAPNANPSGSAPNPDIFPFVPPLEFDSYFGIPGSAEGGFAIGGAVDLGGTVSGQWPATTTSAPVTLNQAWSPGGTDVIDRDHFQTFQLTLSDDADGSWSFLTSVDGEISTFSSDIVAGSFFLVDLPDCNIPEPSSLTVLVVIALGISRGPGRRWSTALP